MIKGIKFNQTICPVLDKALRQKMPVTNHATVRLGAMPAQQPITVNVANLPIPHKEAML